MEAFIKPSLNKGKPSNKGEMALIFYTSGSSAFRTISVPRPNLLLKAIVIVCLSYKTCILEMNAALLSCNPMLKGVVTVYISTIDEHSIAIM